MNKIKHIIYLASFLGAFFLTPQSSIAQRNILELLPGAEKLAFDENSGAQKLIGNVNFIYQGNKMYCDSAYFYEKSNEVRAYGKVHINKNDTLNLFCDSLYYNGKTKYAKLWGHVRVRDREYKITTDSMDYDAKQGQGSYKNGGKIESILTNEVLTSKIGYFHPDTKNFFFSGKVKYKSPEITMSTDTLKYNYLQKKVYFFGPSKIKTKDADLYCEKGWYQTKTEEGVLQKNAEIWSDSKHIQGDSLYHNPKKGISLGKGNIKYNDSLQPYFFSGTYFSKNDNTKKTFITGKALCAYKMKVDTFFIHADTLLNLQDSLGKDNKIFAYNNAKFFKRDIQGKADSMVYLKDSGVMNLYFSPIVWAQAEGYSGAELKGDFMKAFIKDSLMDYIEIDNKSTALMEIDSGQYYNQIAGKKMIAYFVANELTKIDVKGNAQTVYFPEEKKENDTLIEIKRNGMNRIYAGQLKIELDSSDIKSITYIEKPDAVFYPLDKLNKEELFVQNFSWNPHLRPKNVQEMFERE